LPLERLFELLLPCFFVRNELTHLNRSVSGWNYEAITREPWYTNVPTDVQADVSAYNAAWRSVAAVVLEGSANATAKANGKSAAVAAAHPDRGMLSVAVGLATFLGVIAI
jgi:hypothetical protein